MLDAVDVTKVIPPVAPPTSGMCVPVFLLVVALTVVPATSGTEASKLLPTQDTNQKRFFGGEKEILIWRNALQYQNSSTMNSHINSR